MLFNAITIAALLASPILAMPSPAGFNTTALAGSGLIVLETIPQGDDGVITIYGTDPAFLASPESDSAPSRLARRCGSNQVTCGSGNVPPLAACTDLINQVRGSSRLLSSSPRSLCLSRSGKQCCISWSKDIGSVRESDLQNAANAVKNRCLADGLSGLARDVSINKQCLTQCLSNRPNGCS